MFNSKKNQGMTSKGAKGTKDLPNDMDENLKEILISLEDRVNNLNEKIHTLENNVRVMQTENLSLKKSQQRNNYSVIVNNKSNNKSNNNEIALERGVFEGTYSTYT
jgi:TolA-binding protein